MQMENAVTLGIIRELKEPADKRVAFTPDHCNNIISHYPHTNIVVESSPVRAIPDTEYAEAGFVTTNDISSADYIFGVKEVPATAIIPGKSYFIFSHTIKKQPYNRSMLKAFMDGGCSLYDYECFTDAQGARTVAFGHWAGIIGAYNGIRGYGIKNKLFDIVPAHQAAHISILREEYRKVTLPPIKIVVTGSGRVGLGVIEVLDGIGIKEVSPEAFLTNTFDIPVFTQLKSMHYHVHKQGQPFVAADFHAFPDAYDANFLPYAKVADMLIASAFWHPKAPQLFSAAQMAAPDFKIKFIADITCDIEGSIPSTKRASTIAEPFYDYNVNTGQLGSAFSNSPGNITVMAVDNLPCELPRDASYDFGNQLILNVLPALLGNHPDKDILTKACIVKDGKLTPTFQYLASYVDNDAVKATETVGTLAAV